MTMTTTTTANHSSLTSLALDRRHEVAADAVVHRVNILHAPARVKPAATRHERDSRTSTSNDG